MASDVEYATIAYALANVGDPEANSLWIKAIDASPNDHYKITNKRGYADYLFNTGRLKEGRDRYEESLKILKRDDDYVKYMDGYTRRMWGISERNVGAMSQAEEQFAKAEALYGQIQRQWMRDNALRDLKYVRAGLPAPVGPAVETS